MNVSEFERLTGGDYELPRRTAINDFRDAAKGKCPEARTCYSREDLGDWFASVRLACGVIARTGKSG